MPNPAFIVEGHMEKKIAGKLCPGQPVRRIGCNGDNVEIARMCDFIASHIRIFSNKYYPIFIIFDREKRVDSRETLRARMLQELECRGFGDQDIRVFIADREFEDWYLLDIEGICNHYGLISLRIRGSGKHAISNLIGQKQQYIETSTGVEIFDIIDKQKVGAACGEFNAMISAATEIGCSALQAQLL